MEDKNRTLEIHADFTENKVDVTGDDITQTEFNSVISTIISNNLNETLDDYQSKHVVLLETLYQIQTLVEDSIHSEEK